MHCCQSVLRHMPCSHFCFHHTGRATPCSRSKYILDRHKGCLSGTMYLVLITSQVEREQRVQGLQLVQFVCCILLNGSSKNIAAGNAVMRWVMGNVKLLLEWVTVPVFIIALQLPQGAVLYWLASSLTALAQVGTMFYCIVQPVSVHCSVILCILMSSEAYHTSGSSNCNCAVLLSPNRALLWDWWVHFGVQLPGAFTRTDSVEGSICARLSYCEIWQQICTVAQPCKTVYCRDPRGKLG